MSNVLFAQSAQKDSQPSTADLAAQIQALNVAMQQAQAQLEQSQRQLDELRRQFATLQAQMPQTKEGANNVTASGPPAPAQPPASASNSTDQAIQQIREHQAVQDAEIATHDQAKVESASKYPVKLTGLVLLNGFINTRGVDLPVTPTIAVAGSGSLGASVRQTILGFDARGPRLWGAASSADLRMDFAGTPQSQTNSSVYSYSDAAANTLLRLRTAHARLDWSHTQAYFALDRPILSPDSPASLTAVAEPALAWSGNLWMWNPQAGITQNIPAGSTTLRLQAALLDVADAPLTPTADGLTAGERSRWPGFEARVALLGTDSTDEANHVGIGGYFARHLSPFGRHYDAWAVTLDSHLRLPLGFSLTGSAYRGLALGGLGAGAFKDIALRANPTTGGYFSRPVNDVGGWVQLQQKVSERLQLNAAFGTDQAFAYDLYRYVLPTNTDLQNLACNSTWTGNFIYSPSSYLLFSVEYRHLKSAPGQGSGTGSNVVGAAAGYRF